MEKIEQENLYEIVRITESGKYKKQMDYIKGLTGPFMVLREVKKGEVITYSGIPIKKVYYVIEGQYYNFRNSPGGKVNILSRQKAPEWIGIDWALEPAYANITGNCALTRCLVLEIEPEYFQQCIEKNGHFSLYIIKNLLRKMSDISRKTDRLVFQNAREHLMYYIIKYWQEHHTGSGVCCLRMKNDYIAEDIGVCSRTFYRVVNELKKKGMITMEKGNIRVTEAQIQEMKGHFSEL